MSETASSKNSILFKELHILSEEIYIKPFATINSFEVKVYCM